jgi:integrase
MAKAKRIKTRYQGVYKVGERYEWISRRSGRRGMADTLTEARDAKSAADSLDPLAPDVARATFGEYARDWLAAYQGRTSRGFSEGTRERYRDSLELWAIPYFDTVRKRKFADIRKPDVRAFVAWLANPEARKAHAKALTTASGKDYSGRVLSPATIQRTLAPVGAMFADAIEDGAISVANPASVRVNVQPPSVDTDELDDERRAFTPDELAAVLNAAKDAGARLLFDTLAETGVRWGELCELRGRDLKATSAGPRLAIRRAYASVRITAADGTRKRTDVVKLPKSDHGRRDIPLSPELARRLWRLQRSPDELLFRAPQGGRLNYPNTWNRVLAPALRAAGVDWGAGFHTFRHTCASLLFAEGRNVKQVSRWLGHHKASFTLDTYVHLLDDGMGEALTLPTGGNRGATSEPENAGNPEAEPTTETVDLQAIP